MNNSELRFLVTIVNRGTSKKVTKILEKFNVHKYQVLLGRGTTPSEILAYLGLDVIEKDVIFCVVKKEDVESIYDSFYKNLKLNKPGQGISCSIPVSSVAGISAYNDLLS